MPVNHPRLQGVQHLLFDLGGVHYAVDYHATQDALTALAAAHGRPAPDYSQARQSELFDRLETGHLSPTEFLHGLRQQLGLPPQAPDAALVQAWNAMLLGLMPGRVALMAHLGAHYPTALLSNTNAIHWAVVGPACAALLPHFGRVYLSHEMGLRKPDAAVFQHVLHDLGWQAAGTLFIEDSLQHIETARSLGLQTWHLTDPCELEELMG